MFLTEYLSTALRAFFALEDKEGKLAWKMIDVDVLCCWSSILSTSRSCGLSLHPPDLKVQFDGSGRHGRV